MILCCRHGKTVEVMSQTGSFRNVWPKGQFFSLEFAKKTKFRRARTSCGGLWNTCDADLPAAPEFNFTDVQPKAGTGCVTKVQSES